MLLLVFFVFNFIYLLFFLLLNKEKCLLKSINGVWLITAWVGEGEEEFILINFKQSEVQEK